MIHERAKWTIWSQISVLFNYQKKFLEKLWKAVRCLNSSQPHLVQIWSKSSNVIIIAIVSHECQLYNRETTRTFTQTTCTSLLSAGTQFLQEFFLCFIVYIVRTWTLYCYLYCMHLLEQINYVVFVLAAKHQADFMLSARLCFVINRLRFHTVDAVLPQTDFRVDDLGRCYSTMRRIQSFITSCYFEKCGRLQLVGGLFTNPTEYVNFQFRLQQCMLVIKIIVKSLSSFCHCVTAFKIGEVTL